MSFISSDETNPSSKNHTRRNSGSAGSNSGSNKIKKSDDYENYKRNTKFNSEVQRKSSYSTIGSSSKVDDFDEPLFTKKLYPKIGIVKEGFNTFLNTNPLSRYNFIIDRHNEDINKVDNVTLLKINIPNFILKLFDFFTWLRRINFAIILMILSCISEKNESMHGQYIILFQFYSYHGTPSYGKPHSNIILIMLSLMANAIFIIMLIFCFYILIIPLIFMLIIIIIVLFKTHYKNKYSINDSGVNIYKNMIYDKDLDVEKNDKMNEYITISPNGLNEFRHFHYFNELSKKYSKRTQSLPQQFMLYSSYFKNEWLILEKTLLILSIELVLTIIFGSLCFVYV